MAVKKAAVEVSAVEATPVVVPVQLVTFWESGVGKSFRAFLYVAASTLVASLITYLTNQSPSTAVVLVPVVNYVLVLVKGYLTPSTQLLPGLKK